MLKNYILTNEKIDKAKVSIDLIPETNKKARPGVKKNTMKYITVHNTGNSAKGADAHRHTEYVDKVADYISWHLTVDDDDIIQEMPFNEVAYHAGTKDGNYNSIGIEICENVDGNWKDSRQNGINLIATLMIDLNIPLENVVPHKHWSGKQCPHIILREGWDQFIAEVKKAHTEALRALKSNATNDIINRTQNNPDLWIKAVEKLKLMAEDPKVDPDLKVLKYLDGFIENLNKE